MPRCHKPPPGSMDLSHNPVATVSCEPDRFPRLLLSPCLPAARAVVKHWPFSVNNVPIPQNPSPISHAPPSTVNYLPPTSSSQHCILSTVRPVWVKHLWPIHLPTFLLTFNQALLSIQEHTLRCNCITYGLVWTKDILSRHWYDLAVSFVDLIIRLCKNRQRGSSRCYKISGLHNPVPNKCHQAFPLAQFDMLGKTWWFPFLFFPFSVHGDWRVLCTVQAARHVHFVHCHHMLLSLQTKADGAVATLHAEVWI